MITLNKVRVGSVVLVRGDFGSGHPISARVVDVLSNIKNDRPGIDYETFDGGSYWAYLDQVESVVTY